MKSGNKRYPLALAKLGAAPFDDDRWLFELKFDGNRCLAMVAVEGQAKLETRTGNDVTGEYPEVAAALARIGHQCVLDGEVVALDELGRPNLSQLARRVGPIYLYAFDLLELDGHDTRALPLDQRKELLAALLAPVGDPIRYTEHVTGRGKELYSLCEKRGLEGVMAKLRNAPYSSGRSAAWLKLKITVKDEFYIVGWTPPEGSRQCFGSLLLAEKKGDKLVLVGRTGGGFNDAELHRVFALLTARRCDAPQFIVCRAMPKDASFVTPDLRCRVRFQERTNSGGVRHAIYQGMAE